MVQFCSQKHACISCKTLVWFDWDSLHFCTKSCHMHACSLPWSNSTAARFNVISCCSALKHPSSPTAWTDEPLCCTQKRNAARFYDNSHTTASQLLMLRLSTGFDAHASPVCLQRLASRRRTCTAAHVERLRSCQHSQTGSPRSGSSASTPPACSSSTRARRRLPMQPQSPSAW